MLKNIIGSSGWKFRWVLAVGLLASTGAWAYPSPLSVDFNGSDGWLVENPDPNPNEADSTADCLTAPCRYDITGGAWIKNLTLPQSIGQDEYLTLTERLILTTGTLQTWTESILGGEWVWDNDSLTKLATFIGSPAPAAGVASVTGYGTSTLTFDFPLLDTVNLADYYEIDIVKSMRCNVSECAAGVITVVENAAPEPGTLLLLAGGLAGLAGLRRRRYS